MESHMRITRPPPPCVLIKTLTFYTDRNHIRLKEDMKSHNIQGQTEYTMIGESIITCQSDGAWTGAPSCVINGSTKVESIKPTRKKTLM